MLKGRTYAHIYDKHYGIMADNYDQLSEMLDQVNWSKNETILDHGCGNGRTFADYVLPRLEGLNPKIYAIDTAKSMINMAKEKYTDPRITFICTDVLADSFPPEKDLQFDKILSLYVLHFDPLYRDALNKMYNMLVPGGKIIIYICTDCVGMFDAHEHIKADESWAHLHKGLHSPDWLSAGETSGEDNKNHFEKLLKEIGFEIQEIKTQAKTWPFDTKKDVVEFLTSLEPASLESQLHDAEHDDLHNKWKTYLDAITTDKDDDNEYILKYHALTIVAGKPEA